MRFAATVPLVLLAVSAFSAPNPFHLPSLFGGGGNQGYQGYPGYSPFQLHPRPQIQDDSLRGNPKPSSESSSDDDPTPKPSLRPAPAPGLANPMNWITMPFRPNLAAPFYVPTIFGPVTTSLVTPPSITTPLITTTIFPSPTPPIPYRSSVVLEAGQASETPLPTVYARNR